MSSYRSQFPSEIQFASSTDETTASVNDQTFMGTVNGIQRDTNINLPVNSWQVDDTGTTSPAGPATLTTYALKSTTPVSSSSSWPLSQLIKPFRFPPDLKTEDNSKQAFQMSNPRAWATSGLLSPTLPKLENGSRFGEEVGGILDTPVKVMLGPKKQITTYSTAVKGCQLCEKVPQEIFDQLLHNESAISKAYKEYNRNGSPSNNADELTSEGYPFRVTATFDQHSANTLISHHADKTPAHDYPIHAATTVDNKHARDWLGSDFTPAINPSHGSAATESLKKKRNHKPRYEQATYDKLSEAPSPNLDFPNGNITAAELLAFLPHWLKSWDVIERFVSNGGTSCTMAHMINSFREAHKGDLVPNTIFRMMKNAIVKRAGDRWNEWSVGRHITANDWDSANLSTGGFRPPRITHPRHGSGCDKMNAPPKAVPFRKLAKGLKYMPAGYDALDLTRCVEHHANHPEEVWYFPNDYEQLLDYIGGPLKVHPENYDSAAFNRWENERLLRKPSGSRLPAQKVGVSAWKKKRHIRDIEGETAKKGQEDGADERRMVEDHARTRANACAQHYQFMVESPCPGNHFEPHAAKMARLDSPTTITTAPVLYLGQDAIPTASSSNATEQFPNFTGIVNNVDYSQY
ncbi:uncharacterized protein BDR25DRAFT_312727 [Lindgomyces ingoldianus]|uniref:Uncharacterized protein n=1 Tax=Lindgomyces ingoldianus TaxID=673940 RepID=A0ACB6R0Q8_9PLEO|nr:uncharacterized protein BDR25DRAFT_312727 [Lindgomyces ingoldianus]KAF2472844.1 hypothetical protein BDR25DRAFT_312727 [Lindgomyces ingoldianus]